MEHSLFDLYPLRTEDKEHSQRTSIITALIASLMGFDCIVIEKMRHRGLLHDIGKFAIHNKILDSEYKLKSLEWEVIKMHPVYSERILKEYGYDEWDCKIVRWHHEWLDGKGYPDGLEKDEIPIESQILTVADVYDALTNKRKYRSITYDHNSAIKIMKDNKGLNTDIVSIVDKALKKKAILNRGWGKWRSQ